VYVLLNRRRVEELRRDRDWTQHTLADAAGICSSTAKRVERGKPVRLTTARKVAAALDVEPLQRLGRPFCQV
jgi:DNA-binding XRE family transcriptional regulator